MNLPVKIILVIFAFALLAALAINLLPSAQQSTYAQGQYYTVKMNDDYRVVKVIMPWQDTVILSLYKNSYSQRPEAVNFDELYLYDDAEAEERSGRDALPVKIELFSTWEPVLAGQGAVSDLEESEFDHWKEAGEYRWYFPQDFEGATSY